MIPFSIKGMGRVFYVTCWLSIFVHSTLSMGEESANSFLTIVHYLKVDSILYSFIQKAKSFAFWKEWSSKYSMWRSKKQERRKSQSLFPLWSCSQRPVGMGNEAGIWQCSVFLCRRITRHWCWCLYCLPTRIEPLLSRPVCSWNLNIEFLMFAQ